MRDFLENNKIIVEFKTKDINVDIEIPVDITVNDLIIGLNTAYKLGIKEEDINKACLRSENPIALMKGEKMLFQYGIRSGSEIYLIPGNNEK